MIDKQRPRSKGMQLVSRLSVALQALRRRLYVYRTRSSADRTSNVSAEGEQPSRNSRCPNRVNASVRVYLPCRLGLRLEKGS